MKSLKAIRKRITSVKSTQKITKAMKMVAAAKLRRAQSQAVHARDYVQAIRGVTKRLLSSQREERHPFTIPSQGVNKKEFLILTSDRGLCGGFNSNLLRRLEGELQKIGTRDQGPGTRDQQQGGECRIIGKKGRDYFKAKNLDMAEVATGLYEKYDRSVAEELARVAIQRFESKKVDEIWICFNFFKSALVQQVTFQKLLPLEMDHGPAIDYIYEPNATIVLDKLLKESIVAQIHSAFLESQASELAARMAAMDNATKNAKEMIDYLTLVFNRARQASITRELMDIVNAAEALRR